MDDNLKKKIVGTVRRGVMLNSFTQEELEEVMQLFYAPLPKLVDSQTAMKHLQCDKHRLNFYLNQGYLKRIKFGHKKIMIEYNSLKNFMENGIQGCAV